MPSTISQLNQALKEKGKQHYEEAAKLWTKSSSNLPDYEIGEIASLLDDEKAELYFFENGSDIRCKYRYAILKNDIDLLWTLSNDYPPALIALGYRMEDKDKALELFKRAGDGLAPYGYFQASNVLMKSGKYTEGLEFLWKAAEWRISAAYMLLALYYHDKSDVEMEKRIYEKAAQNEIGFAYVNLGKVWGKTDQGKAEECYLKDDLRGWKYMEKSGEDPRCKYFENLVNANEIQ